MSSIKGTLSKIARMGYEVATTPELEALIHSLQVELQERDEQSKLGTGEG